MVKKKQKTINFFYRYDFLYSQGPQCPTESSGHQWEGSWLWPSQHNPAICEYGVMFFLSFLPMYCVCQKYDQAGGTATGNQTSVRRDMTCTSVCNYTFLKSKCCAMWPQCSVINIIAVFYLGPLGCVCICWRGDHSGPEVSPQGSPTNANCPWRRPSLHRNTGCRLQQLKNQLKQNNKGFPYIKINSIYLLKMPFFFSFRAVLVWCWQETKQDCF